MTEEELLKKAKDFFAASRFEVKKEKITGVIVPGSVGILGEANELNRGKVLSGNLDKSAVLMAQKRRENDRSVNLYSKKFDEGIRVLLNDAQSKHDNGWANYISSTFFMLESMSKKVPGMNLYIDNDIPDSFQSNHMEALEIRRCRNSRKAFRLADVRAGNCGNMRPGRSEIHGQGKKHGEIYTFNRRKAGPSYLF